MPFYWWVTHSARRAGAVLLGFICFLVLCASFNLIRTNEFALVKAHGGYVAYNTLIPGLFSPDNGPASAEIAHRLQQCYPENKFQGLYLNVNITLPELGRCLMSVTGEREVEAYEPFHTAFIEAVVANPKKYIEQTVTRISKYLNVPVNLLGRYYWLLDHTASWSSVRWSNICPYSWCLNDSVFDDTQSTKHFWIQAAQKLSSFTTMLFQVPTTEIYLSPHISESLKTWIPLVTMIFLGAFGLSTTQGPLRVLLVSTLLLIFFNVISVAVVTGYSTRYVSHISPLFSIFSTLTLYAGVTMLSKASRYIRSFAHKFTPRV